MADDKAALQLTNVAECLYRRGDHGTFYAIIKKQGRQFRRSLKTKDRKLAERRLAVERLKIAKSGAADATTGDTFTDLSRRWLARAHHRYKPRAATRVETALRQLGPHFDRLPAKKISRAACDEWERKRGCQVSASSFNAELGVLNMVLRDAVEQGLLLDNPARHIKRRKLGRTLIVPPTHNEFQRLLTAMRQLDERAEPGTRLVELLACSGMRLSEATALRWRDVDFDRNVFRVTGGEGGTKNREQRQVPLFPAMRAFLERLKNSRHPDPQDHVVGIGTARRAIERACRIAGLHHLGHHAFRHFFVSNAIEAGVDFATIAAWVGHKDGGVLVARTYGHLRQSHSAAMAEKMVFLGGP